jgi:hypothetical protein
MLNPNRLCGSWFARRKIVKWEFERRFPARYTASNSPRRTSRASRGNFNAPALYGSEPMAALLAARRKHLAASGGLHARTESVRFCAPALARLISALWQSYPPLVTRAEHAKFQMQNFALLGTRRPEPGSGSQAAPAAVCESVSVVDPRAHGQESRHGLDSMQARSFRGCVFSLAFCTQARREAREALQEAKKSGEKKTSIIGVPVDASALIL